MLSASAHPYINFLQVIWYFTISFNCPSKGEGNHNAREGGKGEKLSPFPSKQTSELQ